MKGFDKLCADSTEAKLAVSASNNWGEGIETGGKDVDVDGSWLSEPDLVDSGSGVT